MIESVDLDCFDGLMLDSFRRLGAVMWFVRCVKAWDRMEGFRGSGMALM